jgi:hypothetical protein
MRYRLVKTGKTYADFNSDLNLIKPHEVGNNQQFCTSPDNTGSDSEILRRQPTIWKGTLEEYRAALIWNQAELVLAQSQLTGDIHIDWYVRNRIIGLINSIADLQIWMSEEKGNTQ